MGEHAYRKCLFCKKKIRDDKMREHLEKNHDFGATAKKAAAKKTAAKKAAKKAAAIKKHPAVATKKAKKAAAAKKAKKLPVAAKKAKKLPTVATKKKSYAIKKEVVEHINSLSSPPFALDTRAPLQEKRKNAAKPIAAPRPRAAKSAANALLMPSPASKKIQKKNIMSGYDTKYGQNCRESMRN